MLSFLLTGLSLASNMKVHYFPARASQNLPAVYICVVNCKRLAALSLRGDTKVASAFVCDAEMHCGDHMAQFKNYLVVEEGVEFPGDLSKYDQMRLNLIGRVTPTTKRAPTRVVKDRINTKKAWHLKDWKETDVRTHRRNCMAKGVGTQGPGADDSSQEPGTDDANQDTEVGGVPVRKML